MGGGTPTKAAPDTFQTIVSVPPGWTLQDTSFSDTTDFLMTAPADYQFLPSSISVSAPLPTNLGESTSAALVHLAYGTTVTVTPQTCAVGSDPAAFLSFTDGATVGYLVLWFHLGDEYLLTIKGNGGVDPRTVGDAKRVLSSVTYSHNVAPPARVSPSPKT